MKRQMKKRRVVTNSPKRQNVRKIGRKAPGDIFKPYGRNVPTVPP